MKAACADGNQRRHAENVLRQRPVDSAVDRAELPTSTHSESGTLSAVFCWSGNEEVELPSNTVISDGLGKLLCEAETDVADRFAITGLASDTEERPHFATAHVYNPSASHWTQQDPVGFAGGDADLYRYVACDVRGQFLDEDGNRRDA